MSKESIKMTPGDDTHLTLLMAPVSLNFMTGQDREHLLVYGRAAFEAGQKCQGCDVPKDGVYQISEPMPADKRALMLSVTASEPFKSQLKECAARIAELESQLAAAQQGVQPVAWLAEYVDREGNSAWYVSTHKELAVENDRHGAPQPLFTHPTTQGLEQDAMRYRWLRERDLEAVHQGGVFAGMTPENVVLNGEDLDQAVDASIAAQAKQGEQANG